MGKSMRKVKGRAIREHDLPVQTPAERAVRKAFVVDDRTETKRELRAIAVDVRSAR